MSTIFVPNGVKVELIYTHGTQRVENVYWVTNGSPATLANLQSIWTLFHTWENGTAKSRRSNSIVCALISVTAMDSAGSPFYEAAPSPLIVGTLAQAAAPPYVTIAVKHTTGKTGRSFRGRTYFIGLGFGAADSNGDISLAQATDLAGIYNTLRTQLLAGGWTFSIASLYSGVTIVSGRRRAIPRASGILTAVTASSCERGTDTQRHRKLPQAV